MTYEVFGFLDKNKNTLQQDLIQVCKQSQNKILSNFFSQKSDELDNNSKKPVGMNTLKRGTKLDTVSSQYKVI